MDDHPTGQEADRSLQGKVFRVNTPDDRRRVVELAFDYRGDVTVVLQSGERIEGYVFDRNLEVADPYLKLFPKADSGERIVPLDELQAILFTGEDTAFGKSWDDWRKKSQKASRPS